MKQLSFCGFALKAMLFIMANQLSWSFSLASNTTLQTITFSFKNPHTNQIILENKYRIIYSERSQEEIRRKFFEKASRDCAQKIRPQGVLDEDQTLDIIDICANPRISFSSED